MIMLLYLAEYVFCLLTKKKVSFSKYFSICTKSFISIGRSSRGITISYFYEHIASTRYK